MCQDVTPAGESVVGAAWLLCAKFPLHLAEEYSAAENESALRAFAAFAGSAYCFSEARYFDLDYRSEFSLTHETWFQARNPAVDRLHFFAGDAGPVEHLRDIVASLAPGYRGYIIARPQAQGVVGRSVLATPPSMLDDPPCGRLDEQVRIAVHEHVEVLGVPLVARGVPFMEQDGALLRCAHVSAWTCHYAAVLRGDVPRRPTSRFHTAEERTGARPQLGRLYPSSGLASDVLASVLRSLDMPADVIDGSELQTTRRLAWYDRPGLRDALGQAAGGAGTGEQAPGQPLDARGVWVAENLTAAVCRHLNSGIPSILTRQQDRHTQVVVGYSRRKDLPDGGSGRTRWAADVVQLIVMDDQKGPYVRVPVDELVDELLSEDSLGALITPLLDGLWLQGRVAERAGARLFASAAEKRLEEHGRTPFLERCPPGTLEAVREAAAATRPDIAEYAVRTYTTTGSDFKIGFAERVGDPAAARVVGHTQLPKHVWVVEAVSRALREKTQDCVVGTVVLDASQVAEKHTDDSLIPMITHLPGQVSGWPASRETPRYDDALWTPAALAAYPSGAAGRGGPSGHDAARAARRAKAAAARS